MTRTHVHCAPSLGGPSGDRPVAAAEGEATALPADHVAEAAPPAAEGGEEGAPRATPDAVPVVSGLRASASVLVWVAVRASAAAAAAAAADEGAEEGRGVKWWRSANGVLLTEGDAQGRVGLEWVVCAEKREPSGRRVRLWDGPAVAELDTGEEVGK